MAQEARELEAFFKSKGFQDLAGAMNLIARVADARGLHHSPRAATQSSDVGEAKRVTEQPFYMVSEHLGVRFTQDIGGKTPAQLEAEVITTGRQVIICARDLLCSPEFDVLEKIRTQELLELPVSALGLRGIPTTRQLLERIPQSRFGERYALELPRAEVGPHLAIADKNQAVGDFYYVMHEPIADRRGRPFVFEVVHDSGGRFLGGAWAGPDDGWAPGARLVVALREIESVKA